MAGGVNAHSFPRTGLHPVVCSVLQITFGTALSCLFAWCTRSRMVVTALGVSKSLASAALTAFSVLASLEWDMGSPTMMRQVKGSPAAPWGPSLAWHQP